jgi:hypothetical protein
MDGHKLRGGKVTGIPDRDYHLIGTPHDDHVHICFTGPFQGHQVTWDARIVTLSHAARSRPANSTAELRQFIEVGRDNGGTRQLRIGLNVDRIDEPAILKTIIMIRQYRRLQEGRHEYGPPWRPG